MNADVMDSSSDAGLRGLHRLASLLGGLPEFAKSATAEELSGSSPGAPVWYADPVRRRYNCGSGAATWASAVYFHGAGKEASYAGRPDLSSLVEANLDRMAGYHRVSGAVDAVKAAAARESAPAPEADLPDSAFAYRAGGGKHYPLRNGDEVKAACEFLFREGALLPFPESSALARAVLLKAAEFGVDVGGLEEELAARAGEGTCPAAKSAAAVRERAAMAWHSNRDAESRDRLEKVAASLEADPESARMPSVLRKVATLLDVADRELNLAGLTPVAELFRVNMFSMEKFAAETVRLSTGSVYRAGDLAGLPEEEVEARAGKRAAACLGGILSDGPTAMASLDQDQAAALEKVAARHGVAPLFLDRADPVGLSDSDLEALAAYGG